jgi:hypothetical protein
MNDSRNARPYEEETLECDFSFEIQGLARFRVNALTRPGCRRGVHPSEDSDELLRRWNTEGIRDWR